jgi:hypothetical protein
VMIADFNRSCRDQATYLTIVISTRLVPQLSSCRACIELAGAKEVDLRNSKART